MKNKIIRACLISVFIVGFVVLFLATNDSFNYAFKQTSQINEKEVLEYDFFDDSLIVVLEEDYSQIGTQHDLERELQNEASYLKNLFKDIDVSFIRDLSALPDENARLSNGEKFNIPKIREYLESVPFRQILHVGLTKKDKQNVLESVDKINKMLGVRRATPNHILTGASAQPNDPRFSEQWGLGDEGINVTQAWNITTGDNNVKVGVLDTGINKHEDLDDNVILGWDFYTYDPNTMYSQVLRNDVRGHGTRVAGIIGAKGNNAKGISGVAQKVSLVPLQITRETIHGPKMDESLVITAINHLTNLWCGSSECVRIINCSISGFGQSLGLNILDAVAAYPGLFVWSAGNDGRKLDNCGATELYNLPNLISVGAIDKNGQRSVWNNSGSSCYGEAVNVWAPGGKGELQNNDNCLTTGWNYTTEYLYANGTSIAAPHISGIAALMLSVNTNLSASELKTKIIENSDVVNNFYTPDGFKTIRRANAYEIVKSVLYDTTNLSNNKIRIDSPNFVPEGHIVIPTTISNREVSEIKYNAFKNTEQITKITIPSTVTTIGYSAFENTNNADIYLEGKTIVPPTFSTRWNVSGNPVYLSEGLCTHSSTTFINSDFSYHGELCDKCRTFTSKQRHNHTHSYVPDGVAPSGMAVHLAYCACGHWITEPCMTFFPHPPGTTVTCFFCGQEYCNPVSNSILPPNGELEGIAQPECEGCNEAHSQIKTLQNLNPYIQNNISMVAIVPDKERINVYYKEE